MPTSEGGQPELAEFRTIGQRIDFAFEPPTADLVRFYFEPEGPFAGDTFDTLGSNARDRIGEDDLLALTLLDVHVPALAVRRLLGDDRDDASHSVACIPHNVDLWSAKDEDLASAQEAWDRLTAYKGVGPVIAGKLLARKRPRLVPIFDSVVGAAVGAREGQYWLALRACLAENGRYERIAALRPPGLTPKVTSLRVLDVALWMRYSRGRSARACRRRLALVDD